MRNAIPPDKGPRIATRDSRRRGREEKSAVRHCNVESESLRVAIAARHFARDIYGARGKNTSKLRNFVLKVVREKIPANVVLARIFVNTSYYDRIMMLRINNVKRYACR